MNIENKLLEFGLDIREVKPAATIANYVPAKICGNLLYISGQLPRDIFAENATLQTAPVIVGTLGSNCPIEKGQYAAKMCAMQIFYIAKLALGDLSKIKSCVQLGAFVSSTHDFREQHLVANGASDFICEILGREKGQHSRAAVGVSSLPLGSAVEVSAIFEIN